MNSRLIILIVVALGLAGGAAWLTSNLLSSQGRTGAPAQVVEKQTVNVLVAEMNLPQGTILKSEHLKWQAWPDETLNPNYVVEGKGNKQELIGRVLRHAIVGGEPISLNRTVTAGEQGFLAAILRPGMRAVSISVSRTTGISGLVFPGDRVDIIMTHNIDLAKGGANATSGILGQSNSRQVSETIIQNVRVLAIDTNTDDQTTKPALSKAVTLELTPKLIEALTLAGQMGNLSLSLRSLANNDNENLENDLPLATRKNFTWDAEVSPLIPPVDAVQDKTTVRVSRGSNSTITEFKQEKKINKGASQ